MRKARQTPVINSGSMADIAFLLLIFFLVATTIDSDYGISRRLPPMPKDEDQISNEKINERNVLSVLVNKNDDLLVEGERLQLSDLKAKTREFLLNPGNLADLPEKKVKEIAFFGNVEVSKGVISLQNDRGTSYGVYIQVQNELTAAYDELRNEVSRQKFGKSFEDLNEEQADAVKELYPMAISEAEPKNIGGK